MNQKTNYNYKDLSKAQEKKKKRLFSRILSMLEKGNIKFLTFTFKDDVLKATNQKTRERYIKDYLNKYASEYILNIDYGKTTQREHYHAIAKPKYKLFLLDEFTQKYGYVKGDHIGHTSKYKHINRTLEEIAERLTDHATKESTKNSRIIYSRALRVNTEIDTKTQLKISNITLNKQVQDHFKNLKKQKAEQRKILKALGVSEDFIHSQEKIEKWLGIE